MIASTRTVATLLASALAALALLVSAGPAMAASYNWYSDSDPLVVSDGTVRGHAYGTSYQKDAYLKNHTFYRDRRSNGNAVYTETSYSYYAYCNGVLQWCPETGKDQSSRTQSLYWQDQYDADDYTTRGGDRGRVHSKVCEDQDWSGDPCSRKPYFTFNL